MSTRRDKLRRAGRFAVGLSRGLRMGDFFPPGGRLPPAAAPGGSTESRRRVSPLTRAREEVGWFSVSEHTVPLVGLSHPVRILHLTDVHLRTVVPWLDDLAAVIAPLRPDIIALTGDVITRGWEERAVRTFLDALPPAPLGTFAVMGNWEYWSEAPPHRWEPIVAAHGVQLLMDRWTECGPVVIAGTDDKLAGTPDVRSTLADRPLGRPTVVLTHSPALFPQLVHPDVRLVLSGHSHAGQVRLPVLGATWVPKGTGPYVAGWYQQDDAHLFVSRGIGWSIAPLRYQCPPELALITLEPA